MDGAGVRVRWRVCWRCCMCVAVGARRRERAGCPPPTLRALSGRWRARLADVFGPAERCAGRGVCAGTPWLFLLSGAFLVSGL